MIHKPNLSDPGSLMRFELACQHRSTAVAVAVLLASVFALDVLVPLGHGIWVFYPFVICLAATAGRERWVIAATIASCALIVVRAVAWPNGMIDAALFNRPMAILQMLLTAWLCSAMIEGTHSLREENARRCAAELAVSREKTALAAKEHEIREKYERLSSYVRVLEDQLATKEWLADKGKLLEEYRTILAIAAGHVDGGSAVTPPGPGPAA